MIHYYWIPIIMLATFVATGIGIYLILDEEIEQKRVEAARWRKEYETQRAYYSAFIMNLPMSTSTNGPHESLPKYWPYTYAYKAAPDSANLATAVTAPDVHETFPSVVGAPDKTK